MWGTALTTAGRKMRERELNPKTTFRRLFTLKTLRCQDGRWCFVVHVTRKGSRRRCPPGPSLLVSSFLPTPANENISTTPGRVPSSWRQMPATCWRMPCSKWTTSSLVRDAASLSEFQSLPAQFVIAGH